MTLPPEARPLLHALAPHCTKPALARLVTLLGAAILTPGTGPSSTCGGPPARPPPAMTAVTGGFRPRPSGPAGRSAAPSPGYSLTGSRRPAAAPGGRPLPRARRRAGGGPRRVEAATGPGQWSKGGDGLVPTRWVSVGDAAGPRRGEHLFVTADGLTADAVVPAYSGRRPIATTFPACRSCTGLGAAGGRGRNTVTRAAPGRLGAYSAVAIPCHDPPAAKRTGVARRAGKDAVTFSAARPAVSRWLRTEAVFPQAGAGAAHAQLPEPVRELLLASLARPPDPHKSSSHRQAVEVEGPAAECQVDPDGDRVGQHLADDPVGEEPQIPDPRREANVSGPASPGRAAGTRSTSPAGCARARTPRPP